GDPARRHLLDGWHDLARPAADADLGLQLDDDRGPRRPFGRGDPSRARVDVVATDPRCYATLCPTTTRSPAGSRSLPNEDPTFASTPCSASSCGTGSVSVTQC